MDKTKHLNSIKEKLDFVYGEATAATLFDELKIMVRDYSERIEKRKAEGGYGKKLSPKMTQNDAILITYGDQIAGDKDNTALANLKVFSDKYLKDMISAIHILPFFPYSSDDGFSVIDYLKVNEDMGNWGDIDRLTENFRVMFDYVANHMSSQSEWFKGYLNKEEQYADYFTSVEGNPDLSGVVRPRAHPLLTSYNDKDGKEVKVWTTFSADQVDINYENPKVFLVMSKILLEYYLHGASLVRLDAILYMWKIIGTECAHLEQTHTIIKIWRDLTELVMPEGIILAEVSAPHVKNMTYLGNGTDECHMIYQFPLAPLTLYSFLKQDASIMTKWAAGIEVPDKKATFFNLLACHDGIGVMPARGILPEEEIIWLADEMKKRGGDVSYKANSDGSESPYELNIVYRDAIKDISASDEINTKRFVCAYAIVLAMRGVPGLYIHALLGSYNSPEEVARTGIKRSINRKKFEMEQISKEVESNTGYRSAVIEAFKAMLSARKGIAAFDPYGDMCVVDAGSDCFVILRKNSDGKSALAIYNVTEKPVEVKVSMGNYGYFNGCYTAKAVFCKDSVDIKDGSFCYTLPAYGFEWFE